jgi:hypothetical protein
LLSPPFHDLEELDLLGWNFPRVPKWMGSFLRLGLMLKETTTSTDRSICWEEDMNVIGRLPSLVLLWLRMPVALTERTLIGSSMEFVVLEQFFIDCCGISHLTFEAGALPNLWKPSLGTDPEERDKAPPAGLGHLSSRKKIHVMYLHRARTTPGGLRAFRFYGIQSDRNNRCVKKIVIETRIYSGSRINLLIMIDRTRDTKSRIGSTPLD